MRQQLAFDVEQVAAALEELKDRFVQTEFAVLSTCNRLELYCATRASGGVRECDLTGFLSDAAGMEPTELKQYTYTYNGDEAVRHLLRVACGFDSMVFGEEQILGQVKDSYRMACNAQATGKILNRLFHCAFATAKKVRTATGICNGRASVAGVAVQLAGELFKDMTVARVVVIGAGQVAGRLLRHLLQAGYKDVTIVNRSYENARRRADQYGVLARRWEELADLLAGADIVIASAAARGCLFSRDSVPEIIGKGRNRPLLIIDIAVPRNFDPAFGTVQNVHLYTIDDLSEVARRNLTSRRDDIDRGREIINREVRSFMDWFEVRDIGPLIGRMRDTLRRSCHDELQRFFGRPEQQQHYPEVEATLQRLVGRLLHVVTTNVNTVARQHGPAEAARMIDEIIQQAENFSEHENGEADL